MPQLLIELFSEEIPARMQGGAARDLARMAKERLDGAGLAYTELKTFAGPRRLTLVVEGLPAAQEARAEERKGPRVGSPDAAVDGFLRSTGLARDALTERDGVYWARIDKPGRATPEIVADMLGEILRGFPWPKSMRWGRGTFRWVRPLKRIVALFDGQVVPFEIEGVATGAVTEGHRFMRANDRSFTVEGFADYEASLRSHYVVLDAEARKATILEGARHLCAAEGLELVEDEGLLDEVSGLAEWPTPVLGAMDPSFLDLPPEVIRTSMRTHQKYFAVRDPKSGGLAPRFLVVANIEASDGGAALAAGNARVLSARLNDARFFWNEDAKHGGFGKWLEKLQGVTFHAKLGTMFERTQRLAALAREIAPLVGCTPSQVEKAAEAARLAKGDLASGMVGEFPELQGIMGGYYANAFGLDAEVADAIRDHYKPLGPSDSVPSAPVTVAVALADKLDTLTGFFAIDEKPTGSKDPYALRRAALGVIRIILTNGVRMKIVDGPHLQTMVSGVADAIARAKATSLKPGSNPANPALAKTFGSDAVANAYVDAVNPEKIADELLAAARQLPPFLADRLKVLLRDQGKRHDLVDAVFALGDDDLVRIVARVEALDGFLKTEDGANLLAGLRRATNILKAEAKKNPDERYDGAADALLAKAPEEQALLIAIANASAVLEPKLAAEDFVGAMASLAALRGPVDAFFDKVLVNDSDPAVRLNRLRLLSQIKDAAGRVADFSLIAG
ncbi:MAG: glycine--tRNA ligase subunit beta [Caulobacteraceae bacterium]